MIFKAVVNLRVTLMKKLTRRSHLVGKWTLDSEYLSLTSSSRIKTSASNNAGRSNQDATQLSSEIVKDRNNRLPTFLKLNCLSYRKR